ncbi:MAG TPA: TlpA disulfide reductase family protein [Caulobacteraceae bacterium]|nr:TlpA disulfide reductase family protein [Caulobacteraceae bacterium]
MAAALYVIPGCTAKPGGDLNGLATGAMRKLVVDAHPAPAPNTPFVDAAGKAHTLAEFRGKAVVLNLWATWCAPCVEEMPTLAKLSATSAGQPVAVIPVSVDRDEDRANAQAFIAKHGPLPFYQDPKYALAFAVKPPTGDFTLPMTVLIDARGNIRARLSGGADWSGPDARKLVAAVEKAP